MKQRNSRRFRSRLDCYTCGRTFYNRGELHIHLAECRNRRQGHNTNTGQENTFISDTSENDSVLHHNRCVQVGSTTSFSTTVGPATMGLSNLQAALNLDDVPLPPSPFDPLAALLESVNLPGQSSSSQLSPTEPSSAPAVNCDSTKLEPMDLSNKTLSSKTSKLTQSGNLTDTEIQRLETLPVVGTPRCELAREWIGRGVYFRKEKQTIKYSDGTVREVEKIGFELPNNFE